MNDNVKPRYSERRILSFRPRLSGEFRAAMGVQLRQEYAAGTSIRKLCETHNLSYGTARSLILEAGGALRPRIQNRKES